MWWFRHFEKAAWQFLRKWIQQLHSTASAAADVLTLTLIREGLQRSDVGHLNVWCEWWCNCIHLSKVIQSCAQKKKKGECLLSASSTSVKLTYKAEDSEGGWIENSLRRAGQEDRKLSTGKKCQGTPSESCASAPAAWEADMSQEFLPLNWVNRMGCQAPDFGLN